MKQELLEIIENYHMGLITENEFKGQFWDTVAHGKENWSAFIDFLLESRMAGDFETFANSL